MLDSNGMKVGTVPLKQIGTARQFRFPEDALYVVLKSSRSAARALLSSHRLVGRTRSGRLRWSIPADGQWLGERKDEKCNFLGLTACFLVLRLRAFRPLR
jgi:hypothetical protein